jgi:hypothetical protein
MPIANTPLFTGVNGSGYTAYKGSTTLLFGTDGYLQLPVPSNSNFAGTGYYIVESVKEHTMSENLKFENGTGVIVTRILINNGTEWDVTIQDDSSLPIANMGLAGNVSLCAFTKVNGGALVNTVWTGVVVDTSYDAARKTPGKRVIKVENLTLVDSQSSSSLS